MLSLSEITSRLDSSLYPVRRVVPHKNKYILTYSGTVPGIQPKDTFECIAVNIGQIIFQKIGGNYRFSENARVTFAHYGNETDYTIVITVEPR